MGSACTRPVERVLAAVGAFGGATISFENCRGVDFGGVLCALPALITNGLFEHLDSLSEYGTVELDDTQRVVNPRWRELNSQYRSMRSRFDKSQHKFGNLHANYQLKQKDYEDWKQRKSELKEDIDRLEKAFFKDLNNTEMRYPGTKLRLHFSFAGSTDPPK